MRGKAAQGRHTIRAGGITPAHAGKRAPAVRSRRFRWGSPPHMRGKVCFMVYTILSVRITPAHAGKRVLQFFGCHSPWDHPRTCGEKSKFRFAALHPVGSPPHMRGKASLAHTARPPHRITPAHAGKSSASCGASTCRWDHPRTCGEKCLKFSFCPR